VPTFAAIRTNLGMRNRHTVIGEGGARMPAFRVLDHVGMSILHAMKAPFAPTHDRHWRSSMGIRRRLADRLLAA
jgi:hypothetical protein